MLAIVLVLLLLTAAWIWWNRPKKVDMAAYVPADSLVYLETNSLTEVASALLETEAGRKLGPSIGIRSEARRNSWLTSLARVTGIGSAQSVIAARAQLALVILDLNATADETTLDFKPLAALVVETHTSATRIKPAVEQLIGDFAQRAYGRPAIERVTKDQGEFVKWISPDGKRQIVVSIDGTVAIVGNNEQAVSACLAVHRGQKPSLATQPGLEEMRGRVRARDSMAFGYVSSANAARLLPELAPYLLLNRLPDIVKRCIALSAPRMLGSIGWSAHALAGRIEDVYSISLMNNTLGRLQPGFKGDAPGQREGAWEFLPAETATVTNYNFAAPSMVWAAMNKAISAEQLDVLCAIGFKEVSTKLLVPYGIDDPESFLRAIKPVLLTAKLDADSPRSVIITGVADEQVLRQFVARTFGKKLRTEQVDGSELLVSDDDQTGAGFVDGYFLLGSPEDLRRCLSGVAKRKASGPAAGWDKLIDHTANGAGYVITHAQDRERLRGMVAAVMKFRGRDSSVNSGEEVERVIKELPYAVTETKLTEYGFERKTRSPLGQFSTFVSLLSPEQAH